MRTKYKFILSLFVSFILMGCNADFGDINTNPNKVTSIGSENLFYNVIGIGINPFTSLYHMSDILIGHCGRNRPDDSF